jgi:hypothetical protein
MSQFATMLRSRNRPRLSGVSAVAMLALLATPVYGQVDRRPAEIQGSIEEEECPPAGAVEIGVSSQMDTPLGYNNPTVTSSQGKGAPLGKGAERKGSPREFDCPAPLLTYVSEAPPLALEEAILPLSTVAAAGAGAPLWLAGLPLGVLPFLGGGTTPAAVVPPGPPPVVPPVVPPPVPPPPPPVPPIPEPATWLSMILGFFVVGVAIRRARFRPKPLHLQS